jgi:GAF domain-containing protein
MSTNPKPGERPMENTRDTVMRLRHLQETTHKLGGVLHEQEVVQILLDEAVSAFAVRGALVRLLSPDGDELLPAGAVGLGEAFLGTAFVMESVSQMDQRVLAGELIVFSDVTRDPGYPYPEAAASEGLRGLVAVPLQVRERVVGVLCIYVNETDELSQEDFLLMNTLTDLGALALEKVRLHQSLYRIAEALNATLELIPMLQNVLQAAVKEMGLRGASIRLLESERRILHLVAAYGLGQTYLEKGDVHLAKSPVDQRVLQGEPVVLYDVEQEPGFEYPQEAVQEGIRSVLAVPLKLKQRTLGVMRVYSARPRHFSAVAITFLTSVAGLVALAIENAELYGALQSRYEDLKLDLAEWYRFLALG